LSKRKKLKGKLKEAEKKFKKALILSPDSQDILYNLALVYFAQERYSLVWDLVNEMGRENCPDLVDELNKVRDK